MVSENTAQNFQEEEIIGSEEDTQKGLFLTFHLAGEDFGIKICHVTEIIGIQKITEVPDLPSYLQGVINLRGKVIPVMDVRTRFNLPKKEYEERTCIIVVMVSDKSVGLVVDEVNEVVSIPDSQIEPPPSMDNAGCTYIEGMGKSGEEVKILLDVQRLIFDENAKEAFAI